MNVHSTSDARPASLQASIDNVESRIRRRRRDINIAVGSMTNRLSNVAHTVREQMISPGAIIAAGMFGAAIQRDQRMRGFGMLAILPMLSAGLRHLFATATAGRRLSPPERREYAAAENEFTAEGAPVHPQTEP